MKYIVQAPKLRLHLFLPCMFQNYLEQGQLLPRGETVGSVLPTHTHKKKKKQEAENGPCLLKPSFPRFPSDIYTYMLLNTDSEEKDLGISAAPI